MERKIIKEDEFFKRFPEANLTDGNKIIWLVNDTLAWVVYDAGGEVLVFGDSDLDCYEEMDLLERIAPNFTLSNYKNESKINLDVNYYKTNMDAQVLKSRAAFWGWLIVFISAVIAGVIFLKNQVVWH